ncbi:hypothetical protein EV198_3343 [Roseivirga ehrenbergii]|nr:hypothetical protein [Roseivirga ehrenbergii]TCK99515.1 hypothetical protein EV198_3343 [Roseivirga ehrenbergii]
MEAKITESQKRKMTNPVIQFFRFIYLSLKILFIVEGGHGGTRNRE